MPTTWIMRGPTSRGGPKNPVRIVAPACRSGESALADRGDASLSCRPHNPGVETDQTASVGASQLRVRFLQSLRHADFSVS